LNQMTFSAGDPAYSLSGSTLAFKSSTGASLPSIVVNSTNGVTISDSLTLTNNLTVSGAGSLTLNSAIGGPGSLTMSGSAALILGIPGNSYAGGTYIQSGAVGVNFDSALGTGPVSIGAQSVLAYTSSTNTARTFTSAGGTLSIGHEENLTMNGASVGGAYLQGPGTFTVTGGTVFAGVTSQANAPIYQIGPASFINFTNNGLLSISSGVTSTLNGFTNQASGTITVGGAATVNAADFQSYGMLNIDPAAVGSGQYTLLTNTGTSPMYFNGGSQTFIGTPGTVNNSATGQPNFAAGIDAHGQNIVVAGGLLVNNGFVVDSSAAGTATVVADFGAVVKGAGYFQNSVITQNGGKFEAGNSPGTSLNGSLTIGPGGTQTFDWQINDAGPSATHPGAPGAAGGASPSAPSGQVSGWSLLAAEIIHNPGPTHNGSTGNFTWTATSQPGSQFDFQLETLVGPFTPVGSTVDGAMSDFDPTKSYVWPFAAWQGTYTGPTSSAMLTADTLIDQSMFANSLGTMPGTFSIVYNGNPQVIAGVTFAGSLSLVYTPVPEPGTLALVGLAAVGLAWRRKANGVAAITHQVDP
jgi:fibronectin-binding autotransporter adhesin